jgi:PleD family two-component response regulator
VAQFDPSGGGWESMMRRADTAMYEAKEHGRNAVRPAAESDQDRYLKKDSLPVA